MEQLHGGDIARACNTYNLAREEIIDFSANINFLGPPAGLLDKLKKSIGEIVHYPEPASTSLKKKLADHLGISPDRLITGNGAVELIYEMVKIIKPAITLLQAPTFSEYEKAIRSFQGEIKLLTTSEKNKFRLETTEIIKKLAGVDLLILCNPNNPTGKLLTRKNITGILKEAARRGVFVIIDEAFIDFCCPEKNSVLNLVNKYSRLFVLRSMTKFYAIPGLRLGYGAGSPEIIKKIEKNRDPWSVNRMAQIAGEYVLQAKSYRKKTVKTTRQEREFLYSNLAKIKGLQPFVSSANYIFIDISQTGLSAAVLTDKLARKGLLIRNCDSYHGLQDNYIRIAVKNRQDNMTLLTNLKELPF